MSIWNSLDLPSAIYSDEFVYIIHGDATEILPAIPPDCIDLIPTSPPYNTRMKYSGFRDQLSWAEYYQKMNIVLKQCYRVLVKGGTIGINVPLVVRWQRDHLYANTWFGYDASYKSHRKEEKTEGKARLEPLGFRLFSMMMELDAHVREPIVWVKGAIGLTTTCAMGCDSDPYMRPAHEIILLGSKYQWFHSGGTGRRGKKAVPFADETKDVWFVEPGRDKYHPAVFPGEIPSRLIKIFASSSNAIILDPFLGSGTTALVAKKLGRKCIGIELSKKYAELSAKRCSQSVWNIEEGRNSV